MNTDVPSADPLAPDTVPSADPLASDDVQQSDEPPPLTPLNHPSEIQPNPQTATEQSEENSNAPQQFKQLFSTFGQRVSTMAEQTRASIKKADVPTKMRGGLNRASSVVALAVDNARVATPRSPQTKVVPIIIIGLGAVGRGLLTSIISSRQHHLVNYSTRFLVKGLADSSAFVDTSRANNDEALQAIVSHKAQGKRLSEIVGEVEGVKVRVNQGNEEEPWQFTMSIVRGEAGGVVSIPLTTKAIIADCSASDHTSLALAEALRLGLKVVCANKKPFTQQQDMFDQLLGNPLRLNAIRFESSVGAGLPAITTMMRLKAANDTVSKITGTFSGTLGFVMSGIQEGKKFSEVVLEAKSLGYTEPDPRDDLNGTDVARKALILARCMGWRIELASVAVEPLFPPSLAACTKDEFLERIGEVDEDFSSRVSKAKENNMVLRYAAVIENQKLKVSLTEVSPSSPLGRLEGTDNLLEITSKCYPTTPLVIQGAGAGVETTAAGVLSDIMDLVYTR